MVPRKTVMTTTCDLLVIGAGLAGWTAALRDERFAGL